MMEVQSAKLRTGMVKKPVLPSPLARKRHISNSPDPIAARRVLNNKNNGLDRRCHSLSPSDLGKVKDLGASCPILKTSGHGSSKNVNISNDVAPKPSLSTTASKTSNILRKTTSEYDESEPAQDKDVSLPPSIISKLMKGISAKKRDIMKLAKTVTTQQNALIEQYAALRDLEVRAGLPTSERVGDLRIVSVVPWPAHDLLLLVREQYDIAHIGLNITSPFGQQVLTQVDVHLNTVSKQVSDVCRDLLAKRMELCNSRGRPKYSRERLSGSLYDPRSSKSFDVDHETEVLNKMVNDLIQTINTKHTHLLQLVRMPWLDREQILKKVDRLQKEILLLQNKLQHKDEESKDIPELQTLNEELQKERAARELLKEVVSSAENMLRAARAKIAKLERQLKDTTTELEKTKQKQKETEHLYRHREVKYDARSKKLMEVSKTGEQTIDILSRQRDALEIRVKELREMAEEAERSAAASDAEQRARTESLQAQVAEQERRRANTEQRAAELENQVKNLEGQLQAFQERTAKLLDLENKRRHMDLPQEKEPTARETELYKELTVTRSLLVQAEKELRATRHDRENFFDVLTKLAQSEAKENMENKVATELLEREKKIVKLQTNIEELRRSEQSMKTRIASYESQIMLLRFEVRRLRNYDCYSKDIPYEDLQTELLDMQMQVQSLTRQREMMVSAAVSRSLLLERQDRASEMYTKTLRARKQLAAMLEGPNQSIQSSQIDVSRSMSSLCANEAETWRALHSERVRVLSLESALVSQGAQLEREERVRTQLERRRDVLLRELVRTKNQITQGSSIIRNANMSYENYTTL